MTKHNTRTQKRDEDHMSKAGFMALAGIMVVMIAATMLFAGCKEQGGYDPNTGTFKGYTFDPKGSIEAKSFTSEDELNSFLQTNSGGGSMYYSGLSSAMARDGLVGKAMAVSESMDSSISVPSAQNMAGGDVEFSQTNNQVKNVDEADIIKTDGNYIYTITGNTLFIVKAYPEEEAELVSKITFKSAPSDLFISGDKLAVFGNFYDTEYFRMIDFIPRSGMAFLDVYDISDKASPELMKDYKFEGNYYNARMKEGIVYLLVTDYPSYRDMPMPYIMEGNVKSTMAIDRIHYYNLPYNNPVMVSIHSFEIANPENLESEAVMVEGSEAIYMSEGSIYITHTEYINEYEIQQEIIKGLLESRLKDSDKELIEKIKLVDNDILSQAEKESKIMQVYYQAAQYMTVEEQEEMNDKAESLLKDRLKEFEYMEFTVINKVDVDGMDVTIGDSGKVPGRIINQFSMDEDADGTFRIATTISARWSYDKYKGSYEETKSSNHVYALDESMSIIGSLTGLAEGESIYSTRFIDDRLYMVTFRQVDPFFVIDLSNPRNIKELGQLKIPGFSRYLHPYDEDTIIGIGQDATDEGRTQGLKISLFDVSDVSKPKEIAKFVTEERYASSNALYEHKAFLFSKSKELLVIPAYSYEYDYDPAGGAKKGYNGAFVFKITKDEINLRGLIDHSSGAPEGKYGYYWYSPMVERSLYIDDMLYTKSYNLLRINALEDLSGVKNISLVEDVQTDIPIY